MLIMGGCFWCPALQFGMLSKVVYRFRLRSDLEFYNATYLSIMHLILQIHYREFFGAVYYPA